MADPRRVLSFESRKADEIRAMLEKHGANAVIAPAMKEIPIGITPEIRRFVQRLQAGAFDLVVFMTGVGAEALLAAVETEIPREQFLDWLRRTRIIVRGPKPAAVLKRWNVPFAARADEPNTWHEVIEALIRVAGDATSMPLHGLSIAIQEYGEPSQELYSELTRMGATIEPVSVYRWSLPDEIEPLKSAIVGTTRGEFDVILFTTAQQLVHAIKVAQSLGLKEQWLSAAKRCVIASIGPTASERLQEYGLPVDIVPEHPHMAHLVRAACELAPRLLVQCRAR